MVRSNPFEDYQDGVVCFSVKYAIKKYEHKLIGWFRIMIMYPSKAICKSAQAESGR